MDTERNIAPMKRANDAFDVDTTNLTIEEAVETISKEFSKRIKK
jgi:cytidylate kinase